jgi:hypothetical protein
VLLFWSASIAAEAVAPAAPAAGGQSVTVPALSCLPEQTGGFHDYPEGEESYEPALFHSRPFSLQENTVFMLNLQGQDGGPDLYLTLTMDSDPLERTELECRLVRGVSGAMGLSCVNLPPSEMLLINTETYRFTRSAVGGWTFAGAAGDLNGDSIFIEYGQCQPASEGQPIRP